MLEVLKVVGAMVGAIALAGTFLWFLLLRPFGDATPADLDLVQARHVPEVRLMSRWIYGGTRQRSRLRPERA